MTRRLATALATALVALLAASAAEAKDGVRATLETPIPADARPGARLTVVWSLADDHGRPFGAGGLFVRLRGPGGETSEAYADGAAHPDGRYRATVTVPAGGIESVEFGLRGIVSGPTGTVRGDMLFPLTNPPPPRLARAGESSRGAAWPRVGMGAALVLAAAALAVRRSRV
jgi:hypothetical protein